MDELRVVAIVAEPPVASPGEVVTLQVHVADPLAVEPNIGLWTCAGFGGFCIEQSGDRMIRPEGAPPLLETQVLVPFEAAAIVQEVSAISLWGLACPPDTCTAFFPTDNTSPDPAVLADPFTALESLPLEGLSLVRKSIGLTSDPVNRPLNPTLTPDFELPETVAPSGSVARPFRSLVRPMKRTDTAPQVALVWPRSLWSTTCSRSSGSHQRRQAKLCFGSFYKVMTLEEVRFGHHAST